VHEHIPCFALIVMPQINRARVCVGRSRHIQSCANSKALTAHYTSRNFELLPIVTASLRFPLPMFKRRVKSMFCRL